MEFQWDMTQCGYLKNDLWKTENLESVEEVRLTDEMPDIGRVLCAWGQPVLRSKEWRGTSVAVTGGIHTWVLYLPEDGSAPRCVKAWLPFQAKWNVPDCRRDGQISVNCCLRGVDGRSTSSRKIMVRGCVGVQIRGVEEATQSVPQPAELPEGVQVRYGRYPAVLPSEAGEKMVSLETQIPAEEAQTICGCEIMPDLPDREVVGSRAVFRGVCRILIRYLGTDGNLRCISRECPIANYAQLDMDYEQDAFLTLHTAVTDLETEIAEGEIQVRAGLVCQYTVYNRQMLQIPEDAYSLHRELEPTMDTLALPWVLDRPETVLYAAPETEMGEETVDISFLPEQPVHFREGKTVTVQAGGTFQMLSRDETGEYQCRLLPWAQQWQIPLDENGDLQVSIEKILPAENGEWEVHLEGICQSSEKIPVITCLHLGEAKKPDSGRPALILRRAGDRSLWELAKLCNSTVDAIEKANRLTAEPEPDRMLLIPVP